MEAKLLPCPFCGSSDVTPELNKMNWPAVQCVDCGALGPCIDIDADKAAVRWNTRLATDPITAERDGARRALFLFREFVLHNAKQWLLGSGHHHPMWSHVSAALGDMNESKPTEDEWRSLVYEDAALTPAVSDAEKDGGSNG